MRRSAVLLAGAMVVAGGAALFAGDAGPHRARPPAASIAGAALAPAAAAAAPPPADPASPIETSVVGLTTAAPRPEPRPGMLGALRSTAPLGSMIDLDRITRVADHYEAPLRDGRRAILTLDPELQPLAEQLLTESRAPKGGIVVMATDGRILALAGRRTEDPKGSREGTFDWRLATDVWAPAASVFKLVTASALVGAGVDPTAPVCFHGGVRSVMESNLVDHKQDGRCESLAFGVAHSNNAILGKLAYQKLEPDTLDSVARKLGLAGALPGDQLPGNVGAIAIPTVHDLSFARTAAGFSGAELSVAGGALLAATFANDGMQPVPRLIASIDGATAPTAAAHRVLPADTARAVAKMMVGTCESGSAAKSFRKGPKLRVAGKTGTLTRDDPYYIEHSWFVGFAPYEKPEIIVSVLFGNPESWHLRGHEGARRLVDRALRPPKPKS